jgi:hypothetical protein
MTAAILAAVISACSDSGSDADDDEAAVEELFNEQLQHFRAGDFDALYANYSPAFREQCTQDALVASIEAAGTDPDQIEFQEVTVVVDGDLADVTYAVTHGGEPLGRVDSGEPDVYARVDGRWYDELDAHTHC